MKGSVQHRHLKQTPQTSLIRLPGDSLVHQALLQSVSQSLMYEGVTDKCSSFAQRGFQLQKHMVLHKL